MPIWYKAGGLTTGAVLGGGCETLAGAGGAGLVGGGGGKRFGYGDQMFQNLL